MQLTRPIAIASLACLIVGSATTSHARAQARSTLAATVFHEGFGGPIHTTVITPSFSAGGPIGEHVEIEVGWDADIVSGASVAIVDAPTTEVDVISSATHYDDFRNMATAGISFLGERTRLNTSYTYGRESDYTSHAFTIGASAELFERNTTLELRFSRGFDRSCNLYQPASPEAVDRQRLPGSDGCFGGAEREWLDVNISSFEGIWTQNITPRLAMQATLSAQLVDGFQSNPYRSVWLGNSAAQEHHPEQRVRYSAAVDFRLWARRIHGAFTLSGRGYRDTWDIMSVTGELAYEQRMGEAFRLRVRGRYYQQSGAAFYSDDYVLQPRGQYFTGDRELAPMRSIMVGGRLEWDIPPGDDGEIGFFSSLMFVAKADYLTYDFDFHYGAVDVPNDFAVIGSFSLDASF